tara:strand:- start:17 stop:175 length:159 start_codon:yes stop_codon:yes gene_type:complete
MKSVSRLLKKVLTRVDNQKSIENAKFRNKMKLLFNDDQMFKKKDNKILYLFK